MEQQYKRRKGKMKKRYTLFLMLVILCIIFSDWVGLSGLRFFKYHEIKDEIPKYLSTLVGLLAVNISVMFILAIIFRQNFCSFFKLSTSISNKYLKYQYNLSQPKLRNLKSENLRL